MTLAIARRAVPQAATLAATGIDPVLARLFAARGIRDAAELDCGLAALPPFHRFSTSTPRPHGSPMPSRRASAS